MAYMNLDIDHFLHSVSDNFDATLFLFPIENFELALLLPVIYGSYNNLHKNISTGTP
jgi:hypothetical protein